MMRTDLTKRVTALAVMYNNFGPYHLARLAVTTKLSKEKGLNVVGIELASHETIHPWSADKAPAEINQVTIFANQAIEKISSWKLVLGTWFTLNSLNPQAMAIGLSKNTIYALLTALLWARLKKCLTVVMMDSKFDDAPRHPIKEWVKKRIYSCFHAALVGGTQSRHYAEFLGIAPAKIFVGCDVVDNDHFAQLADYSRGQASSLREQYHLPKNYFLCVSRLSEKKNLFRLLEAYNDYYRNAPQQPWGLVICGSGPLEQELKDTARQLALDHVRFSGFAQVDTLPVYYGLARCFILPSSHSEQWGLVVNEAMAAGLPVLVSQACGCAPDLVQEGVNGYTFNPYDVKGLAQLLLKMSSGGLDLQSMGEASRRIIANWSLDTFAQGLLAAVKE
ncbi:MAG: glycosyltransferase family 4 protein [Desulfobaccales bacterium]